MTTNLVTARRRRALGVEATCSDAARVKVTATIFAPVKRLGRRPRVEQVQIGTGSVVFGEGDTKQAELTLDRGALRQLAKRTKVTVTLVATATPDAAPSRGAPAARR